jgi:UDP-N-acetylglucosamine--N-acetylmuramyl-(pentapeptide) pyrophosphoryl-undecaprenol N-acetylglucosamine transferase
MSKQRKKILICGGGTGGHLYPALAVADALKKIDNAVEILFVGAQGKIEQFKVPAAGYNIELLPVRGFARRLTIKNLSFFFKLIKSLWLSRKIVKRFAPDAVIGVGGYAAGPVGYMAANRGIPLLIQEQNSYPGVTNKLLARKAEKICVAYKETERFFPKHKIILTGNPVRESLLQLNMSQEEAKQNLGFDANKKLILSLGGSGGAKSINEGIAEHLQLAADSDIQVLWQTGAFYYDTFKMTAENFNSNQIQATAFVERMDIAYRAADIVISRAGAGTVSELCLLKKPAVLVPSPYVAEDHQSKNAQALTESGAALHIKDSDCKEKLLPDTLEALKKQDLLNSLAENIYKHARHNSAERIATELLELTEH